MGIYEEIGVRPFINAGGWMFTRYGGTIMAEEVVAAMGEASRRFVNIYELQDRVGEAIAKMTGNEAAYVSCGAASGILLTVATCIAGRDEGLANRLPETNGLRNEVIMRRCGMGTEADAMVRGAGGRIVEVGGEDRDVREIAGAMNERTAAVLLLASDGDELAVKDIVQAAREREVKVLVDGACAVPPKENFWRYTREMGVDAFIVSGGKGIRGPQSTGLVLGTREMIEGCKFHGSPNLRIGRGMKVGKEEFAGIYAAVKLFLKVDGEKETARERARIESIARAVGGLKGVRVRVTRGMELLIDLEAGRVGKTAEEVEKAACWRRNRRYCCEGGRGGSRCVRGRCGKAKRKWWVGGCGKSCREGDCGCWRKCRRGRRHHWTRLVGFDGGFEEEVEGGDVGEEGEGEVVAFDEVFGGVGGEPDLAGGVLPGEGFEGEVDRDGGGGEHEGRAGFGMTEEQELGGVHR